MRPEEDTIAWLVEQVRTRFHGKYRGVVDEVGEGDQLGFLRVRVPDLYGDNPSPWAEPAVPLAGVGYGLLALPQVGDGVWIECVAGNRDRPVWTGCWWSSADDVPDGAAPEVRVFRSPAGHRIEVDDDAGELRLTHSEGSKIVIGADEIRLEVGNGTISVRDGKVSINGSALEVE